MDLSLGVRRSLQQCALPNGTFAMLAMDQRGSLVRAIQDAWPGAVEYADVAMLKRAVIGALSSTASAVLLDVEYGYPACVSGHALAGDAGLLLALEKSGYEGDPTARQTALLEGWPVERTRKAGASGVKLLVYYRPDAPNASAQEALVADVAAQCQAWDLPLFLEPLHYSLDPNVKQVPNIERRQIVVESARRLVPLGVDVLKAEFPVDVAQTTDQAEWADACAELSEAAAVPWVLLSAGVDFDTYIEQVAVACRAGASGVLCGRAIWKEAVALDEGARQLFLLTTARTRLQQITNLVSATARPYTDFYPPTAFEALTTSREDWFNVG